MAKDKDKDKDKNAEKEPPVPPHADGEKVKDPSPEEPEPVDTFYDEESEEEYAGGAGPRIRVTEAAREINDLMRDTILKSVPLEVTEHLNNSRNELLKAGIALMQSRIRNNDESTNRARDLHGQKREPEDLG